MDPYCLSVEREASKNIEENERECFKDAIVSSRSLNKGYVEPMRLKTAIPEIAACIIAASFHVGIGIMMAYSAILVPALEAADADIKADKSQTSWMASIVVISTPVGALMGSFLMEAFGRLRTLQIGALPYVLGWILIAMSDSVTMILIGRLLSGLATALAASPAVVYITEVARPELRGSLVSLGPTLASLGILLVYLMGWLLHWRTVAWVSIAYVVLPVFLIQFVVPESPVWLVSKARLEQARASIDWLHRCQPEVGKASAFASICKENAIRSSEQRRSHRSGALGKLRAFLRPTGWKPMLILFLLFAFQQFSGIYITLFYAVTWFTEIDAGFNPYLASVLVGVTRFLCSMVNTWLLRRFKRRVLCIVSSIGMAACMSVSGYFTMRILLYDDRSATWVPVLCLLLYVCASMVGLLTIPWTMTAELFPTEIRELAHAISYSIANILMFTAVQSYRQLVWLVGGSHAIQWFFAGVSIGAAVYVWLLLPETHDKKLSEIEDYFHGNLLACGAEERAKRLSQRKAQAALLHSPDQYKAGQIA
ncbi:facilitated trehalose transporter Tret1-like isoform X2 [Phymastichus coffea]|uniref:facilitated trehalose transporter Tret1-like isoform X2 n=1 Tax=Phymastichus coffea TaxID=108790 RepID=UPI00273BCD91|nr:facilitated trehalose transporter Tret1-like isoform X2 [Phymastichus coffea]XP_058800443.1 facilitated trehalose transporter Tret1-like isoform X2 [Phymastichus coffea]XP_058800444.1 facilitated trehalose transporter Tret1-like isoform X2 [Phymastichus coffea]